MIQLEKRTYTLKEVAEILGVSLTFCYIKARAGKIPTLRIGKKYVVPATIIEKLLSLELKID